MAATILTFCHWSLCGKQKVIEEVRIIIGYKKNYFSDAAASVSLTETKVESST